MSLWSEIIYAYGLVLTAQEIKRETRVTKARIRRIQVLNRDTQQHYRTCHSATEKDLLEFHHEIVTPTLIVKFVEGHVDDVRMKSVSEQSRLSNSHLA